MTKPLFTVTFTPEQAIDFIKQKIKDNYSSIDEFDVVIQQKPTPDFFSIFGGGAEPIKVEVNPEDKTEVNPWLIPDDDGWFMHDPEWKSESNPSYILGDRKVVVSFRNFSYSSDYSEEYYTDRADSWDWSVTGIDYDIIKWKYVD